MNSASVFLQQLVNGLSLGSIYALIALGYTMVYGIVKLINFAHGDIMMMGAYAGYFVLVAMGPSPIGFCVAMFVAMLFCALLGLSIERLDLLPRVRLSFGSAQPKKRGRGGCAVLCLPHLSAVYQGGGLLLPLHQGKDRHRRSDRQGAGSLRSLLKPQGTFACCPESSGEGPEGEPDRKREAGAQK